MSNSILADDAFKHNDSDNKKPTNKIKSLNEKLDEIIYSQKLTQKALFHLTYLLVNHIQEIKEKEQINRGVSW